MPSLSRAGLLLAWAGVFAVTDLAAAPSTTPANTSAAARCANFRPEPFLTRNEISPGQRAATANLLLRFLHFTDDHVLDDEGQAINGASPTDAVNPVFEAAQRLQEEYTDEVLNDIIGRTNECNRRYPAEFMIVTGDSADLTTVAELRRFIDNLDGTFDQLSAFERSCVASLPAGTPSALVYRACTRFTGHGVADTQSQDADVNDPTVQFTTSRTARQLANQAAAQAGRGADGSTAPQRQTYTRAPGLPESLRCTQGQPGCGNQALSTPWLVAFGNHDGYLRGTAATGAGPNEASWLSSGRHHMRQQREFIAEFFATRSQPQGHGFNFVDAGRQHDTDPRNNGYYAFTAESGKFRMIVLNTIIDGSDPRLPTDLVRNPLALADGTIDQEQFSWLQRELQQAWASKQIVMIFSHHPDITFAEYGVFAQAIPLHVTAAQLNAELASWPHVIAWVAGHTHRHRIRPFAVTSRAGQLQGSNKTASTDGASVTTPVQCKLTLNRRSGRSPCTGFWQIETASLIDFPQEQRMVEVFDNRDGTGTLRLPVFSHGFERSKRLAAADDRCQLYLLDPSGVQTLTSDAGTDALCRFGGTREGSPLDRNVELTFAMPTFNRRP